ncbi:hypothetical protein MMC07_009837, partial [Pseudocyphellaria aurata]|nr:hypothetical protein [Pseudocyphellaria aurata]
MDPVSVTASIIAILQLSTTVLGYLNDVKDASKSRKKCATEASNLYHLLLSLRFRLEDGSSNERWFDSVKALGFANGPLDQFQQVLEQLQTKMTGGSRLKKVGDALMWKFTKEEVTNMLARMERLKTLVQVALEMDHFKLSQAIKESTDSVQSNIEAVQNDLDVMQQAQGHAAHEKLMKWISPTDFPAQQSDFIDRRQKGTGQWFLDASEFTEWLHGPNQTLFCPGIPGAGKTMITAIVIDHLSNIARSGAVGVAYVYCNYKSYQNTVGLLAAILKQLVQARPSIAEPIERLHMQHAVRGTRPSLEDIFKALQSVLTKYSSVYVAVDALDECSGQDGTHRQFLAMLRDLQGGMKDLRLMATSRFIPDIVREFSAALKLEIRASDVDIKRFVAGQTYRLPQCIRRDDALQVIVQNKIVQSVDGMFLLARLHIDSLLDKRTKSSVQRTIDSLSKGSKALNVAYDQAIERIKGQLPDDSELAANVLTWIIHAQRQLTTGEIRHALAVQSDDEELDHDNILDIEDIVSVCAGLVTVDEESDTIRLVHYTTQEYFVQVQERWNFEAQLKIASTCLTYLSCKVFRSHGRPTKKSLRGWVVQSPFLVYAARFWGIHTFTVQEE